MKRLEGKVAVVTGGNSGIGLAAAKRLQEEGARVAISGRNAKTLEDAVKTIGNGVLAVQSDVAKAADLEKLYATVSKEFGKIDVLFVNAGIYKFAPFEATGEGLYDESSTARCMRRRKQQCGRSRARLRLSWWGAEFA
jgi:NAD(P)-dependent dehydrogenase (short-subunit alcohol dehydrogenase family)